MDLRQVAVSQDSIAIVRKIAWSVARGGMMEYEEAEAEGLLAMVEAMQSWDEGRGVKLETWVYRIVEQRLIDLIRKEQTRRRWGLGAEKLEDLFAQEDGEGGDWEEVFGEWHDVGKPARLKEFFGMLSSEAREVLEVVLRRGHEELGLEGHESGRDVRSRMRWWMMEKKGWGRRTTDRVFKEIRLCWQEAV